MEISPIPLPRRLVDLLVAIAGSRDLYYKLMNKISLVSAQSNSSQPQGIDAALTSLLRAPALWCVDIRPGRVGADRLWYLFGAVRVLVPSQKIGEQDAL